MDLEPSINRKRLCQAVILQALVDATSERESTDRQDARLWFRDADEDFREVCELAEMEPDEVQRKALNKIGEIEADTSRIKRKGTRPAKTYEHNGEIHTLGEWADILGLSVGALQWRLRKGLTHDAVFKKKLVRAARKSPKPRLLFTLDGKSHTLQEWSEILGVSRSTLRDRLKKGYPPEDVFTSKRIKSRPKPEGRSKAAGAETGEGGAKAEGARGKKAA